MPRNERSHEEIFPSHPQNEVRRKISKVNVLVDLQTFWWTYNLFFLIQKCVSTAPRQLRNGASYIILLNTQLPDSTAVEYKTQQTTLTIKGYLSRLAFLFFLLDFSFEHNITIETVIKQLYNSIKIQEWLTQANIS